MNNILESYVNPAYVYKFCQGPDVVRDRKDALRYGINCVALAHLAIRDLFDYALPRELQCAEMYLDRNHFEKVNGTEAMRQGDLVWFGIDNATIEPEEFELVYEHGVLVNWADFPVKHVSVYIGNKDERGVPLLLHATHVGGTNAVWPVDRFVEYRKYRRMYGITRLIPELRRAEDGIT